MSNKLSFQGSAAIKIKKKFPETTIHKIFETNSSFHVK